MDFPNFPLKSKCIQICLQYICEYHRFVYFVVISILGQRYFVIGILKNKFICMKILKFEKKKKSLKGFHPKSDISELCMAKIFLLFSSINLLSN